MIGAEIDASRQGSSFDFRISRAIALALVSGDEDRRARRAHAAKAGIGGAACVQIESFAAAFMNPASGKLESHDV